jgi:hypothetical protein
MLIYSNGFYGIQVTHAVDINEVSGNSTQTMTGNMH